MTTAIRVLIVEDSEDDTILLLRELRAGGYDPQWARVDSPEGLTRALDGQHWDVILCGSVLFHLDALQALKIVQGSECDIPFIIMSSKICEEAVVPAMEAGAHDYVMKDRLNRLPFAVRRELRVAALHRERRQAEKDLIESKAAITVSEEKYRNIFQLGVDSLFLIDQETGAILEANSSACRTYGYTHDELLGLRNIDMSAEPEQTALATQTMEDIHALITLRYHRKKDGTIFPVEIWASLFEMNNRKVLLISTHDISLRKQAETILQNSEAKFRMLFQGNQTLLVLSSQKDGRYLDVNDEFLRMTGYSREEVIGRTSLELGLSESQERIQIVDKLRESDEALNLEIHLRTKTGDRRTLLCNVVRLMLHDEPCLLVSAIDNTERIRAEEELDEYRLRLEDLVEQRTKEVELRTKEVELLSQLTLVSLESAAVGAWWIDFTEDGFFHALDTTVRMIGIPISQLPGKAYPISDWVHVLRETQVKVPEYTDLVESALERFAGAISGKYEKYSVVYPVAMPDQTIKWIDARADISSRDKDGHAKWMTGTLIDVTQLVLVGRELSAHKTQLEGLVAQRTDELDQRNIDLQKMSERLILAARAAKIGVWDWDIVRDELEWDDGMYNLYNISREHFDGAYDTWSHFVHPDDKEQTEKEIQEALRGEKEYSPEFRIIWPDGSIRHIQASSLTFRNPDGRPIRMVGINWDTTEAKKAESEVRESEMRFRAFVEQSKVAIGVFSQEGIGLYANQKFLDMLGLPSIEKMIGKHAFEYFAPQFTDESKERILRRSQGLPVPEEFESVAMHADGSQIPVKIVITPIHLPSGKVHISFITDITEVKASERLLREESARYQCIIESTKDWIWVVGSNHYELTFFNTAIANFLKETLGIILKPGMTPEEMFFETRVDEWKDYYSRAVKEGQFEIEYNTAIGGLYFEMLISPLVVDGQTVGVSIFGKDVTNEVNYKEKLEISNQKLLTRLDQSLNAISRIGELRDVYTAGHQRKVTELACAIAQELGLSDETISNISNGALIHDIGKIYIASDILNKPGKISSLEYQILQTHVEHSYEIVREIDFPPQVIEMIHQHHERMDGSGYPQKLTGDQIILESRILAVADVVEAMTSHRPYRPALGIDAALGEISLYRGIRYDCDVVDACVRIFNVNSFAYTI